MSRELKDALGRIYSDDFKKMQESERQQKKNGSSRNNGQDRTEKMPLRQLLRVVMAIFWLAIVAVFAFATVYYYNEYKAALVWIEHDKAIWDNELQRRASLLPKLILVSGRYSDHEKVLFETVAQVRGNALKNGGEAPADGTEPPMNKLMSSLLAVSEQYPDLKATQSFQELMKGMVVTADRITESRASYIRRIKTLNDLYTMFPSNIFGRLFFIENPEQWKMPTSDTPDLEVDQAFKTFLEARAVQPPAPAPVVSATVAPTPAAATNPEATKTPDPAITVAPEPLNAPAGVTDIPLAIAPAAPVEPEPVNPSDGVIEQDTPTPVEVPAKPVAAEVPAKKAGPAPAVAPAPRKNTTR